MSQYVPKIQETEKGKYYYGVICPKTDNILVIDEDPSEGGKRFPDDTVLVSCHHCQTNHLFDGSEVKSLRATGEE
jgi:hypothetical protein